MSIGKTSITQDVQNEDILDEICKSYTKTDAKLIVEAFSFAKKSHAGQKRASGEDYIIHPVHTALILSKLNVDAKTVAAGLLHDVLDDTQITAGEMTEKFGEEITFLVEGVSKLGKIKYRGVERHAENLRKMLLAMAQDLRVILIKLADRYHNLSTLDHLPANKQRRIAQESLDIYAPLAFRLGMSELSKKIEDLAFKYCHPSEYEMIIENVKQRYPSREKFLASLAPYISKQLAIEKIKPLHIQTRAKHYWSLYEKLKKYDMNWDAIHDLVAMRIIVKDIEQCYATLGVIHKLWRPLPGRIKDYIALPKPNGYQSLHTTVFCRGGNITEFQIRTKEMHDASENGIAAHWLYTESGKPKQGVKANTKKLDWVSQIHEWQNDNTESSEFIDNLKFDMFSDRIFAFTPRGDVIDLPDGATSVDFAYAIHTKLGDTCSQAKINGILSSLNTTLKNGDVVEIISDSAKKPSRDWLSFVKTNAAKSRIKACLKQARREEKIIEGQLLLDKELSDLNQPTWRNISLQKRTKVYQNLPYKTEELLLSAIGEGDLSPYRAVKYVISEKEILAQRTVAKVKNLAKKNTPSGVSLSGDNTINTRIALCCSPLPGENIRAYITTASYAAIHKEQCPNLLRLARRNPARSMTASWQALRGANTAKLKISAFDRLGLAQEITSNISNMGINMLAISAEKDNGATTNDQEESARIDLTLEVFDIDQLKTLVKSLEKIRGIREVKRG